MPPQSGWEWNEVGREELRPKKRVPGGSMEKRVYVVLECPLGCGGTVEVLESRLSKHRSIAGRAHYRKCTMLSESQRKVFDPQKPCPEKPKAKKCGSSRRQPPAKKRRVLPAPPPWEEGTTAEAYIESFAHQP